jgi:hypothetical protein
MLIFFFFFLLFFSEMDQPPRKQRKKSTTYLEQLFPSVRGITKAQKKATGKTPRELARGQAIRTAFASGGVGPKGKGYFKNNPNEYRDWIAKRGRILAQMNTPESRREAAAEKFQLLGGLQSFHGIANPNLVLKNPKTKLYVRSVLAGFGVKTISKRAFDALHFLGDSPAAIQALANYHDVHWGGKKNISENEVLGFMLEILSAWSRSVNGSKYIDAMTQWVSSEKGITAKAQIPVFGVKLIKDLEARTAAKWNNQVLTGKYSDEYNARVSQLRGIVGFGSYH